MHLKLLGLLPLSVQDQSLREEHQRLGKVSRIIYVNVERFSSFDFSISDEKVAELIILGGKATAEYINNQMGAFQHSITEAHPSEKSISNTYSK